MLNARQSEYSEKIKTARQRCLDFAKSVGAPLVDMTYVATFQVGDTGIEAWFFYETNEQKRDCEANGTSRRLAEFLKQTLVDLDYSFELFPELSFHYDSKQNVDANCYGSYFLRLR
jgi:hypothetical protein